MKKEKEFKKIEHLGLIMDGNRRWAVKRGLPSQEGHRVGYKVLKEMLKWCGKRGIKTITVYAFSVENWKRSEEEVNFLLDLLLFAFEHDLPTIAKKKIKINIIGSRAGLTPKILKAINTAERKTRDNKEGILNICFNYSGRLEIVEAVQKIIKKKLAPEKIDENLIAQNLWLAGQSDPDLIIRTSGEQRLSGFLTWQAVYSELYFCKKNWPDFSEKDLDLAIAEYQKRNRRFGGG